MADTLPTLAHAARRGGRAELEALLRETTGYLHALARARLGDGAEAEIATGDALARIAGGFGRLRDPQAYPHWAYRILQRCIARRGARARPTADPTTLTLAAGGSGPAEVAVQVERRHVVAEAVAALPARLREPVMLHFTCGLAYREIADLLGVGLGTVSRRIHKALRRLEPHLGGAR